MGEAYIELLKAFNFKEMQMWIATISAILFSSNLLGGILSALMFVNSSALRPRPLKERISFRLFLLSEVMLLVFVFFYHVFMIERISISHIVFWASAILIMPLLAVIGSQSVMVSFSSRMKAKAEASKRQQRAIRAKRAKQMDKPGGTGSDKPGNNPAARALSARKGKSA